GVSVAPAPARSAPRTGGTRLMPDRIDTPGHAAGGEEGFGFLFEESVKTPQAGEVVTGRIVHIGRDTVTVDIGYKCEGEIPIFEFTTREGELTVQEGEDGDVYLEG